VQRIRYDIRHERLAARGREWGISVSVRGEGLPAPVRRARHGAMDAIARVPHATLIYGIICANSIFWTKVNAGRN